MIVTSSTLRAMRLLYARGESYEGIAGILGVSKGTVCYWARKDRGAFPRRTHGREWWEDALKTVDGLPAPTAARRLGCDKGTVYKWRRLIDGTR